MINTSIIKHIVFSKIYNDNMDSEYNFFSKINYHDDKLKQKILKYLLTKSQILPFKFDGIFTSKFYNINRNDVYTYYYYHGYKHMIPNGEVLKTMFENIILFERPNIIYVLYNNTYYTSKKFIDIYLKNPKEIIKQKILVKKFFPQNNLKNEYDLVILLFVGNNDIGIDIINNLYKNKSYQTDKILMVIVTLKNILDDNFYNVINNCFKQYIVFEFPYNFGSDISPSILAYELLCTIVKFKTILKIHTKTNNNWRNNAIKPFIENKYEYLLSLLSDNIGIIGSKYIKRTEDIINESLNFILLYELYGNDVKQYNFSAGTIFMCNKSYFDKCIEKINEIIIPLLYMQYYDVNYLFFTHSPAHTVERIFGITSIILNKTNLYI